MFKIPYSLMPPKILKRVSKIFYGSGEFLASFFPSLRSILAQADIPVNEREYLSMCLVSILISSLFLFLSSLLFITGFGAERPLALSLFITLALSLFIFMQQLMYPKMLVNRKIKKVERNLIPALQNMLVQLNSGVSLFEAVNAVANSDYGGVSDEFSKVIQEINAGKSPIDALEEIAVKTPSLFFRRVTWQVVNGMKAGANTATVLESILESLTEEKIIQIQKYGSQLNPLAMFYMLVVVIMPSLGMAFLIVISSFMALSEFGIKSMFFAMYAFVVFAQIMFLGMIKSKRPNLMGD